MTMIFNQLNKSTNFSTRKMVAVFSGLVGLLLGLLVAVGCGEDEIAGQVGSIKIDIDTANEIRIGETDVIWVEVYDDEGVAFGVLRGFDPRDVKWKSSNSSIVDVSYLKETVDVLSDTPNVSYATVVGKKAGMATITATYKGVSDSGEIKVR